MHLSEVEFVLSAVKPDQFPKIRLAEVAFAGRSNVGKSSLLNTLLGQKKLARVSSTPGCTRAINFYRVSQKWSFADLPGYGFARVPRAMQEAWRLLLEGYLTERESLRAVVLIVDIRRDPMEMDKALFNYLRAHDIPIILTATKADKLSSQQAGRQIALLGKSLGYPARDIIRFSSSSGDGRLDLWKQVYSRLMEPEETWARSRPAELEGRSTAADLALGWDAP